VHVRVNGGSLACCGADLFAENNGRSALSDEAKEVVPQMPWIVGADSFAGDRERLARTASRPEGPVVGPAGEAGGVGPPSKAGEEMAGGEPCKVGRSKIDN
jgi:hypothetical protein